MATHQWLSRAPIVEASIQLSVDLPGGGCKGALEALTARLAERYPRREQRLEATPRGHVERCRFSGDARHALEVSVEGLTCGRLAPYGGFGPLVGEALWAWEHYLEIARPIRLTRLGVRFRNCFELPLPLQLDRLFLTGPRVAPSLPQTVGAVESRITLQCGAGTHAVVTQRIEEAAGERARIGFDIEVLRGVALAPDSHLVWQGLGELAAIEHRIFFESVTDEALASYV